MSSQSDLGFVSLLATVGISAFAAVDLNSDGSISYATGGGANPRGCGVSQENAPAGRYLNVKLWSAPGSWLLAVSPGNVITPGGKYGISNGFVAPIGTGVTTSTLEGGPSAVGVASSGIVLEFYKL